MRSELFWRARGIARVISAPMALTWRVPIWAFAVTSVLNLVSDPFINFRASSDTSFIPFVASIPSIVFVVGAGAVIPRALRRRIWVVASVFFAAAIIRPFVMFAFIQGIVPSDATSPLTRPFGSLVTFSILLITSFVFNSVYLFRDRMTAAILTRERLRGALEISQLELSRPPLLIDSDIRHMIDRVITEIRDDLSARSDANELQRLGDAITHDATQRIRSLSREFSDRWTRAQFPEPTSDTPSTFRDLVATSVGSNLYFPILVPFLTAGTLAYGLVPRSPDVGLSIVVTIVWFASAVVLSCAARAIHRRIWPIRDRQPRLQALFFFSAIVAAGIVSSAVSGLLISGPQVTAITQFVVLPLLFCFFATGVGFGTALVTSSERLVSQTDVENDEIARVLARVNAQRLRTNGTVSQFLHGHVQGQLIAASLLVRRYVDEGASVDEVRMRIENLLDTIVLADLESVDTPPLEAGLASIFVPWSRLLEVEQSFTPEAVLALESDSLARFIVFDAVREAVNNGVKHGDATSVHVYAHVLPDGDIELVISNNGTSSLTATSSSSGSGLSQLESITTALQISTDGDRTALRVRIPVTPVAS